ncbi:HI0933 family protein [Alkaliphilus metalliredigens QYMF]|uniref:HI0933 family protein n=1 Tax=Alkaliphilus metalliredigens (strain QYMF) TaxID=293826 RepID=A6TMW8_ALKMQ|nr:NAD(P)/FAD-dependent oxidoreductase [Alkaliphilus metalliredigens]ABR47536.1 HI0933 family protein [Alkaliphilus metalliredigens QYMF]
MNKKETKTILVIGGGAAGMIASIAATRQGAQVIILEKMNRVGKKILATGNGRCNLTNIHTDLIHFHGNNVQFIRSVLGQFSVEETINFFEYLGIAHKVEEGKVYPFSDQAASVLDVLRYEMNQLGVKEHCDAEVREIHATKQGFTLALSNGKQIKGDRIIVTTGGKASPQLGSNGSGYDLVKPFGHLLIPPFPALVQLNLKAHFLKALKGVKFNGLAEVNSNNKSLRREEGEILFTDYGISGPPILQLSRKAGEVLQNKEKPWIQLDLFPHLTTEELKEQLMIRLGYQPEKPLDFALIGLLNKRLIPVVLKETKIQPIQKLSHEVSDEEMNRLVSFLKGWRIEIEGTQDWKQAQVTAGGIDVNGINPKTLESKLVPGMYFAGEILDIDGDCGGFNLQWAWSSGYIAGEQAATE